MESGDDKRLHLTLRQHALLVGFWIKTDIYDMYSGLQAETNTDTFKAATMKLSHVFFFFNVVTL